MPKSREIAAVTLAAGVALIAPNAAAQTVPTTTPEATSALGAPEVATQPVGNPSIPLINANRFYYRNDANLEGDAAKAAKRAHIQTITSACFSAIKRSDQGKSVTVVVTPNSFLTNKEMSNPATKRRELAPSRSTAKVARAAIRACLNENGRKDIKVVPGSKFIEGINAANKAQGVRDIINSHGYVYSKNHKLLTQPEIMRAHLNGTLKSFDAQLESALQKSAEDGGGATIGFYHGVSSAVLPAKREQ